MISRFILNLVYKLVSSSRSIKSTELIHSHDNKNNQSGTTIPGLTHTEMVWSYPRVLDRFTHLQVEPWYLIPGEQSIALGYEAHKGGAWSHSIVLSDTSKEVKNIRSPPLNLYKSFYLWPPWKYFLPKESNFLGPPELDWWTMFRKQIGFAEF